MCRLTFLFMNCCAPKLWFWLVELVVGPSSDPNGGEGFELLVQFDALMGPTMKGWELLLRNC